jgi:hypothetical protein
VGQLRLGVIGATRKENERRLPIHHTISTGQMPIWGWPHCSKEDLTHNTIDGRQTLTA